MQFQFDSLAAFWAMGIHGPYVWGAYGITFACLTGLLIASVMQKKRLIKQLKRAQRLANPSV